MAHELLVDISPFELISTPHSHAAVDVGVALAWEGKVEALMKGALHTDEFMHAAMEKETGIRTDHLMSHIFVCRIPHYPKLLLITDAAINIYPTLEEKQDIVQNAINLAHAIDIKSPKVAILSAVETVTSKITATVDAAALCKMADRGQIKGGILDGPLAFDNAISKEAAQTKHIVSRVCGDVDILVCPDLEAANMLVKQLEYLSEAQVAGIVLGAKVPIILTSRSDKPPARLASCALASIVVHKKRNR
jgi:phosphotransacetylase